MTPLAAPLIADASWYDPAGLWIAVTGAVAAMACATVGSLLVLRRMSLMGDAISHAVLPGLALAFLWRGSYQLGYLLVGAAAAGLLAAILTQTLHQFVRISPDASMGIVFTTMFACGVLLIRQLEGVHFDVQCVYEGALEFVSLYTVDIGGWDVPRALVVASLALTVNLVALLLLWKEWKISSFDADLATTLGFSATRLHYLLMALTAGTTVACFEAVGSILVVAMLIVPAATAHLLTERLAPMIMVACAVATLSAFGGYGAAHTLEQAGWSLSVAGLITVCGGAMFGAAVLFAPGQGVLASLWQSWQTSLRVAQEDLLALLYRAQELPNPRPLRLDEARRLVGDGWIARRAVQLLLRSSAVRLVGDCLELTADGLETARQVVRGHRLWEAYLVEHVGLAADHVHEPADRVEHYLDENLRRRLEQRLDDVRRDPHGRAIP